MRAAPAAAADAPARRTVRAWAVARPPRANRVIATVPANTAGATALSPSPDRSSSWAKTALQRPGRGLRARRPRPGTPVTAGTVDLGRRTSTRAGHVAAVPAGARLRIRPPGGRRRTVRRAPGRGRRRRPPLLFLPCRPRTTTRLPRATSMNPSAARVAIARWAVPAATVVQVARCPRQDSNLCTGPLGARLSSRGNAAESLAHKEIGPPSVFRRVPTSPDESRGLRARKGTT
jgi:hypothetical protein